MSPQNTCVLRIQEASRRAGMPKTLSRACFFDEITPPAGGVISQKPLITPPKWRGAAMRREKAWGNRHASMVAVYLGFRHMLEITPPGVP